MRSEYGRCLECGRRIKNRVYYKGLLIYICPRHLKGKSGKEITEYLDILLRYGGKSSQKLYEDILKSLSILDAKISTLIDKIDSWMKIIGQKRLDDYKLGKNIEKLVNMVESAINMINSIKDSGGNIPETSDELSFLNSLIREYPEVHYRVEDGLAIIKLRKTSSQIDSVN